MGNEIQHYDEQGGAMMAAPSQSSNLLAQIIEAASNPDVDATKMTAMAELALKLQAHEKLEQFNKDFIAACAEMPVITKSGRIVIPGKNGSPDRVQGTFAKFEDLNRVVKPILDRHNLWITFKLADSANNRPACRPILWHRNGHVDNGELLSAPLENSGSKNDTQGVGSTTSYLKRYTMCAALNIVVEAEDDDGNGGGITMPEERVNLIVEAATAANDDGRYQEWFREQSPKDRGWLVKNGYHARFGGAPALTGSKPEDTPGQASTGAAPNKPASGEKPIPKQGREWADGYLRDVAAVQSLDKFALLQDEHKDMRERAKLYPTLWREIQDAEGRAMDELSKEAEKDGNQSGGGLFGDDQ